MSQLLHAYWHKTELIKTLQATEHVLTKSYTESNLFRLLRTEIHSVRDLLGNGIDYGNVTASQCHAEAVTSCYQMIIVMMCLGLPARIAEKIRATRNDHRQDIDKASSRLETLAAMLSRPMPRELVGADSSWKVVVDSGAVDTEEDEGTLDGFLIDASWFQNEAVLCDLGFSLAWLWGLNETKRWGTKDFDDPGRHWTEWDSVMSFTTSNETILLSSVHVLMVGIVAELKAQVDIVSTMQTKILGFVFSAAMVVSAFLYNLLFEERVDAWTETAINRTFA